MSTALFLLLAVASQTIQNKTIEDVLTAIESSLHDTTEWEMQLGNDSSSELPWKKVETPLSFSEPLARFRSSVTVPAVSAGTKVNGGRAAISFSIRGPADYRAEVFVNGKKVEEYPVVDAKTRMHQIPPVVLTEDAKPGESYAIEVLVTNPLIYPAHDYPLNSKQVRFGGARLELDAAQAIKDELQRFMVNLQTAETMTRPWSPPEEDRPFFPERVNRSRLDAVELSKLRRLLEENVASFNVRALERGDSEIVLDSIKDVLLRLEPISGFAKQFTIYLTGNAHIDLAWLWRTRESVVVSANTFRSVLNNQEAHPELIYAQSQAQTYDWVEKHEPQLFERIVEEVKEGTWDIVGGMWAEPDCNIIGGESWVRQILYGQTYFQERFGKQPWLGWNPDSFGYNSNMPQFYKKGGIDAFITQKISWNQQTRFPYHLFWWEAPDGSRILTYLPTGSYGERVEPERMVDQLLNFEHATGLKEMLSLIGLGNHGGGPNLAMLERAKMLQEQPVFPNVQFVRPHDYIEILMKKDLSDLPVWKSEMYLENHRGTLTSQAGMKRHNRRNEAMLETAEKAAAIARLLGSEFPRDEIERAWKIVLLNQFHDILPGSSITPVYRDADETSKEAHEIARRILFRSLQTLAERFGLREEGWRRVLVFNPLSWNRDDWVRIPLGPEAPARVAVSDVEGTTVPSRVFTQNNGLDRVLVFRAVDVPPLGVRFFSLQPQGGAERESVPAERYSIENEYLKVAVSPQTGNIASIYDKPNDRELLDPGSEGNVIELHENLPDFWDAWNIGYTGRSWIVNDADSVELVEENDLRSVIRVRKSFLGLTKANRAPTEGFPSSFFTQDIILYRGSPKVDVEMEIDWWEDHTLLKVAFPLAIESDVATYETAYGSIERSTRRRTEWEKARYEVPVHRWADVSSADYGVSLLNDRKYGMDIHGSVMRLTLLTSPLWPDPMADRGRHRVVYSIYPHVGDRKQADTVRLANELNLPLIGYLIPERSDYRDSAEAVSRVPSRPGRAPAPFDEGFVRVDKTNAVVTALKEAEAGGAVIARVVETRGIAGTVLLEVPVDLISVVEVDLLEREIGTLQAGGRGVSFELNPFEIKSLKLVPREE